MQTGYSGTKSNCPRYVCARAKRLYAGEHACQSIGGIRLGNTILVQLFAVLAPADHVRRVKLIFGHEFTTPADPGAHARPAQPA